jgi:hypothetical protein
MDRVAQMVVKQLIEPDLDPIFLADSYGYRPRKSAIDAIGVTRKRCWKYDWVLEDEPMCQWQTSLGSSIHSCGGGLNITVDSRRRLWGQSFDTSIRQSRLG